MQIYVKLKKYVKLCELVEKYSTRSCETSHNCVMLAMFNNYDYDNNEIRYDTIVCI